MRESCIRVVEKIERWIKLRFPHFCPDNGDILDRALHSCTTPGDTALFRSLPDQSGNKRDEEHAQDYTPANIPDTDGQCVQADLVDWQMVSDAAVGRRASLVTAIAIC